MEIVVNKQKAIWGKVWEDQDQDRINVEKILDSRFTKEAYRCLKKSINSRENKLILEAGCGTGRFCCLIAKDFPNSRVVGIDISQHSLKIANRMKECLQLSNVFF